MSNVSEQDRLLNAVQHCLITYAIHIGDRSDIAPSQLVVATILYRDRLQYSTDIDRTTQHNVP